MSSKSFYSVAYQSSPPKRVCFVSPRKSPNNPKSKSENQLNQQQNTVKPSKAIRSIHPTNPWCCPPPPHSLSEQPIMLCSLLSEEEILCLLLLSLYFRSNFHMGEKHFLLLSRFVIPTQSCYAIFVLLGSSVFFIAVVLVPIRIAIFW